MNKKQIALIIGVFFVGLAIGFFAGREYLKYQITSGINSALKEMNKTLTDGMGIKSPLKESGEIGKNVKRKAIEATLQKEKESYIEKYIKVYDIESKYQNDIVDGDVACVFGKIQNTGTRTLSKVEITAYFRDQNDKTIYENSYRIVSPVSIFSEDNPLKSNYIREFGFKSKGCPAEWKEGNITYRITDIEFSRE